MFALSAFSTYDSLVYSSQWSTGGYISLWQCTEYEVPVDVFSFDSVQNMKRSSYTVHIILKGPSEPD
jgi:hypothetical protein